MNGGLFALVLSLPLFMPGFFLSIRPKKFGCLPWKVGFCEQVRVERVSNLQMISMHQELAFAFSVSLA
jgi:hypothetical protein